MPRTQYTPFPSCLFSPFFELSVHGCVQLPLLLSDTVDWETARKDPGDRGEGFLA